MPRKKKQDLATLPDYERMSDTVDNLSEQKKSTAPAKKTRQERKAERKEIKARKKSEAALKKKAKKLVIPKTVQQTIPYLRVYPDSGIIETKNGVFTKGYLLQDVNYTSARDEEQTDMFLKFAEFLNTFDPQTQFQILISQQNLNMAQFEQETMMPLTGDGLDELREEINNEVRTKIKQGRNNLIKYKYLFLQRTESSYEEAVASFARLDGEIVTNFSKIGGAVAQPMTSAKRLELLHDIYNPDSVGLFGNNMQYEDGRLVFSTENFRFDVMRRMGLSTKDMVAPDSFTFRPDYGMVGNQYFRVLYMKTYPESLRDSILKSLSDVDCKLVLSMHYVPINPERALSMVRADIVNVNANLIKEQKNASKSGYSVDLINPTLQAAAQDLNNLLDDLTAKSQKLFYQTFAICHFADSKEKLDSDTKTIQSIGRGYLVDIRPLTGQQEIGLNSCLPLCSNKLEIRRTLITESAAVFMPLDNQELYNPEKGSIFYGINEGSKNLVYANRLDLKNGNGNIIGAPGSGKSTASKKEMEEVRLKDPNAVIIVIDPEGEYKPLAELLGGEVIRIAPGSGVNLNPFDIELDTEEENPIAQKSDFIKALMQTIIGGDNERQGVTLTAAQASIIDRCVKQIYEPYLQSYKPETGEYAENALPTLTDFYYLLRDQQGYDAMQLADALEMYTTGTLNFFAHKTNVEYTKNFVVYDIQDIGNSMKSLGMQIILNNVWNRIIAGRKQGHHVWFYVDEFHLLLNNTRSAEFMNTMFKRARKYGAIPTGITQNIGDVIENPIAKDIYANSEFMMIFSQKASECALLSGLMEISQSDIEKVKDALPGHGIMIYGNKVIAINTEIDKDSIRYKAMTTKLSEMVQREKEARLAAVSVPLPAPEPEEPPVPAVSEEPEKPKPRRGRRKKTPEPENRGD